MDSQSLRTSGKQEPAEGSEHKLRISEIEAIERFARHIEQKMQYDLQALKLIDPLAVHQAWIETLETEVLKLKGKALEEVPTR